MLDLLVAVGNFLLKKLVAIKLLFKTKEIVFTVVSFECFGNLFFRFSAVVVAVFSKLVRIEIPFADIFNDGQACQATNVFDLYIKPKVVQL